MIRASSSSILDLLTSKGTIFGYRHEGYWADVGTPEDYLRIQKDIITGVFKPQEALA